jgi:hypothetical protein
MFQSSAFDPEQPGFEPVRFERAAQRAVSDLHRVVVPIAQRALGLRRRAHPAAVRTLSWRALLDVEALAFSAPGFRGRHDEAIVAAFLRVADSRLPGPDLDEAVDWRRDDDDLPAVYLIVRAMLEAEASEAA